MKQQSNYDKKFRNISLGISCIVLAIYLLITTFIIPIKSISTIVSIVLIVLGLRFIIKQDLKD